MPTPNTSNKKAKLNPNGLKRVFKMVWNDYKWLIIIIAILVCVNSFANVYGNAFQQRLIDDYITPMLATSSKDFSPLLSAIIQMIVIYAIGVVASYVLNRLTVKISLGTLNNVRERLFAHMQTLPIKYFDTHPHGDIMSVYTNDTDTLRQTISSSIPQVFSSLITIIMVIISMFSLSWILALITLSFSILMLFIAKKITHKSGKYFRQQQRELGHVNGYIEEMIEGSRVIKVFSHEQQVQEDFDKINDTLCQASTKANTFANILMPICMNFGYVSYVVCAIVGSYFAIHGMFNMTVGTIAAMLSLNKAFNNPITQISQQLNAVIMSQAGAARIFEILDEPSESDSGIVTLVRTKLENDQWVETKDYTGHWCWKHPRSNNGYELVPLKGDVIFDDVTFGYNEDKTVLHDINLYAHAGQKVALVGATGAGKTTITNLVNRFYDIQKGTITYDGINIELIEKPDLRRSLGVVLQDTQLFSGTIMDNIRFGKLDATDEECIAAAKLVRQLHQPSRKWL